MSEEDINERLHKFHRRKSVGVCGWSLELFLLVWAQSCSTKILDVLNRIALDTIGDQLSSLLGCGVLLPIPKQDGVRPIVLCEFLLQLVFGATLLHLPKIESVNAVEIVHRMQTYLDDGGCVLKIDCKNAFNTISRKTIAGIVYVLRCFDLFGLCFVVTTRIPQPFFFSMTLGSFIASWFLLKALDREVSKGPICFPLLFNIF